MLEWLWSSALSKAQAIYKNENYCYKADQLAINAKNVWRSKQDPEEGRARKLQECYRRLL